ncbi:MAG: RsmD family RNA methyltransferase [Oscillospiraceae bacterium]|nr:RsmD family RNA methyltransferase [Oscillospiraceae bacterium]
MRVISGTARGRKLKEPTGFAIRPTSDMVKESVFDIIQFDIEGRGVLDLFAGTGQLGIEALSRGAKSAVFIDTKPEAIKLIWENLKICGFTGMACVYERDALKFLIGGQTNRIANDLRMPGLRGDMLGDERKSPDDSSNFDLIIVDPPYNSPLAGKALSKIIEFDKLNQNGIIICELKANDPAPIVAPPYFLQKEYKYGSVKLVKYERSE